MWGDRSPSSKPARLGQYCFCLLLLFLLLILLLLLVNAWVK
uniref:Uncharacterized protein n=1 Tax=Proteus mirabilis TaxID=584 RepID=A0A1L5JN92_PROMI|nr:hypothetical protein [Proteus mirabilis]APO16938.1 hypothetical protein [Proteus mirabilis]APO17022.1 hypothetical protein [Proteus mirabilis]